jgi:hypothetical protein
MQASAVDYVVVIAAEAYDRWSKEIDDLVTLAQSEASFVVRTPVADIIEFALFGK